MNEEAIEAPKYLYKALTYELWEKSQHEQALCLPPMDDAFIHFSTEAQIERTVAKFFADVPEYVILKIETAKLKGDLVYESNPGSTSKYYHIYNGSIPCSAVVECKLFEHHK